MNFDPIGDPAIKEAVRKRLAAIIDSVASEFILGEGTPKGVCRVAGSALATCEHKGLILGVSREFAREVGIPSDLWALALGLEMGMMVEKRRREAEELETVVPMAESPDESFPKREPTNLVKFPSKEPPQGLCPLCGEEEKRHEECLRLDCPAKALLSPILFL